MSHNKSKIGSLAPRKSLRSISDKAANPSLARRGRTIRKWLEILDIWRKEKELILKLTNLSLTGRSRKETYTLALQSRALIDLFDRDLKTIETRLKDLSFNTCESLPSLTGAKREMKRLAGVFQALKHDILVELVKSYPITIV